MRSLPATVLICLLAPAAVAPAQEQPSSAATPTQEDPLSAHNRFLYGGVKKILLRTAETMPEEDYGFKPTEAVRSFGQVLGHAADAQYAFCSIVLGEPNPAPKVEQSKTSKAELIAALQEAFAYCDRAYDGMTDQSAAEPVKLMGRDMPKLGALTVNNVHSIEHYGNLVTYLRMNGLVPPTSDPEFMRQLGN